MSSYDHSVQGLPLSEAPVLGLSTTILVSLFPAHMPKEAVIYLV